MTEVLVVDDDPDILTLVQMQLRRVGYTTRGAASGDEALALVRNDGPPDIAVLDVTMPGMTGFELLVELRKMKGLEKLPAIFLSARVQPKDIAEGTGLGAQYLTKPFVPDKLFAAIKIALAA